MPYTNTSSYSGFFPTLIAAANEASAALVFNTPMLEYSYRDFRPEPMDPRYGTLNIVVPGTESSGDANKAVVTDIGSNGVTWGSVKGNTKALAFTNHPAYAFPIPTWDMVRTPADIRALFLDEAIKRCVEYLENQICALVTAGNFNVNTAVSGSSNTISAANMKTAWKELVAQRCPVHDFGNMFLVTQETVYAELLADTTYWTPNSQVGYLIATQVRRQALLGQQWGAFADFSHYMPSSTSGSPAVTTYTSLLFHRFAIALGLRPLPPPTLGATNSATIYYRGIPLRVIVSWVPDQIAYGVTIDFGYALGVVRPELGVLITS